MGRQILSITELNALEQEIDKISVYADMLNPSNPDDAELLHFYDLKLDECIQKIERSYKNARIDESGFQLIG